MWREATTESTTVRLIKTFGAKTAMWQFPPRGSNAELIVRVARDNDLILDLESVIVNGQRYAVRSDADRMESQRDYSIVGQVIGAISGGQVRGRAVRIPRDSVISFRLERPLEMGVSDRGIDRDGYHYHDWYRRDQ